MSTLAINCVAVQLVWSRFYQHGSIRDGKENVLFLTDAFSKISQAFVTLNQKALTMDK